MMGTRTTTTSALESADSPCAAMAWCRAPSSAMTETRLRKTAVRHRVRWKVDGSARVHQIRSASHFTAIAALRPLYRVALVHSKLFSPARCSTTLRQPVHGPVSVWRQRTHRLLSLHIRPNRYAARSAATAKRLHRNCVTMEKRAATMSILPARQMLIASILPGSPSALDGVIPLVGMAAPPSVPATATDSCLRLKIIALKTVRSPMLPMQYRTCRAGTGMAGLCSWHRADPSPPRTPPPPCRK